jgi:shikimate 5-dehydrogenase
MSPQKLIFDTVYNPMTTLLLRQARAAGAQTINGVEMFVRQAAAQFRTWTDLPAPMEVMREVVVRRLQPSGLS